MYAFQRPSGVLDVTLSPLCKKACSVTSTRLIRTESKKSSRRKQVSVLLRALSLLVLFRIRRNPSS